MYMAVKRIAQVQIPQLFLPKLILIPSATRLKSEDSGPEILVSRLRAPLGQHQETRSHTCCRPTHVKCMAQISFRKILYSKENSI